MTLSYQSMRHKLIWFLFKNSDVLYRYQQRRMLGTRANYLPNPIQIYKNIGGFSKFCTIFVMRLII